MLLLNILTLSEISCRQPLIIIFNLSLSLENGGLQGSKQVYLAGDDPEARDVVSGIVRTAGFSPVDMGRLVSARQIEDIPVSVFQHWRTPFYIHLAIFTFLYVLSFVKMQVRNIHNTFEFAKSSCVSFPRFVGPSPGPQMVHSCGTCGITSPWTT